MPTRPHNLKTRYYIISKIFKVERKGESRRFKAFRDLDNHQLLWHGSGVTNYAGILSQGLRIAPPEAPVVGADCGGDYAGDYGVDYGGDFREYI